MEEVDNADNDDVNNNNNVSSIQLIRTINNASKQNSDDESSEQLEDKIFALMDALEREQEDVEKDLGLVGGTFSLLFTGGATDASEKERKQKEGKIGSFVTKVTGSSSSARKKKTKSSSSSGSTEATSSTKSMTEFVGENGSGKSQLCLQLLLETVSGRRRFGDDEDDDDDDDGGFSAVYVTTEGQFPVERLREIWRERRKMQRRRQWEKEKRNVKNNDPGVREEEDAQRRRRKEEEREDEEDERRVLDSIYVFQAMGNAENCWEVLRITHLLKEFAWKHDLAVVVTNHVVDSFDDEDDNSIAFRNNINVATKKKESTADVLRASNDDARNANDHRGFQSIHQGERTQGEEKNTEEEDADCYGKRAFPKRFFTSNRFVKPGLGLAWSNCPNSSVFLTRDDNGTDGGGNSSLRLRRRRRADAFRSPFAEARSCAFRIETEGIVNDEDDDESGVVIDR
ncbi:unnamed protein product [Bathycoccus prasinos]